MGILCQPLVPDFTEAKLALHDAKGVFHSRADFGFVAIAAAFAFRQLPVPTAFSVCQVNRVRAAAWIAAVLPV